MSLSTAARLQVLQTLGLQPLRRRPPPLTRLQISGVLPDELQGPEWRLLLQALGINAQRCAVQSSDAAQIELRIGDMRLLMSPDELRALRSQPARKREWWSLLRPLRRALHSNGQA